MVTHIGAIGQRNDRITRAIAQSSHRTGMDFRYLMGQAKIESGLNPDAKARTSSATGLFQFLDQSWLAIIDKHGSKHGLDWAKGAISRNGRGQLTVSDPGMRSQILELRRNPELAALMAGELAADNRDYLEAKIGREMAPVDLYLAHFLGAEGARKFLSAHDANPDAAAAPHFGQAARANRAIFYGENGEPRSFAEIRQHFADKLDGAGGSILPRGGNSLPMVQPADYVRLASMRAPAGAAIDPANAATATGSARPPIHDNARLAYLLLASLGA